MAPMRAFSVLQKRPKIAKMTPNDLLRGNIATNTVKDYKLYFTDNDLKYIN